MANLTPTAGWDNVVQLETDTKALGGPGGIMNAQAQALLNRTEKLASDLEDVASSVTGQHVLDRMNDASDVNNGDAMVAVEQTASGGIARTQHDRNQEDVRLTDFGANDTAFAAVEALPSDNAAVFLPPGNHTTARGITKTLVGPGSIVDSAGGVSNMNAWRSSKIITHDIAGRIGDVSRLQSAISEGSVKVAIWGHSIAEGTNDIAYNDSWAGLLEQYFLDAFPGVKWTFVNYSIAGKDVGEANSDSYVGVNNPEDPAGTNFYRTPGWQRDVPSYTLWPNGSTVGKTWYNHIRDESPDLVIINFGMNGTIGSTNDWASTLKNIVTNRIRQWAKVPSIAFVTDMLPTRKVEPFKSWNAKLQANADAARGLAQELNFTLLDANRLCRAYREGIDVAATRTRFTQGATDIASWIVASGARPSFGTDVLTFASAGAVFRPQSEINFEGSATFNVSSASVVFGFQYRADPANLSNCYSVFIQPDVPQVVAYYNGVAFGSSTIDPVAIGNVIVKVKCIGAHHQVFVNSKKVLDFYDYQSISPGYYGLQLSGPGAALRLRVQAGYARCIGYNEIPDEVMCGIGDELTNPNSLGGHSNHPSVIAAYTVYFGSMRPLIQAVQREVSRWRDPMIRNEGRGTTVGAGAGETILIKINTDAGKDSYMAGTGSGSSASYGASAFHLLLVDVAGAGTDINVALVNGAGSGLAACVLTIPSPGKWLVEANGTATTWGTNIRNVVVAKATRVSS